MKCPLCVGFLLCSWTHGTPMPRRPSVTAMPGLGFLELSGPKALEAVLLEKVFSSPGCWVFAGIESLTGACPRYSSRGGVGEQMVRPKFSRK